MGTGPQWFLVESMWENCSSQWWANLLFIQNFYPWFTMALNGCMNWTQIIASHVQIIAMTPFFVILFKKVKVGFHILSLLIISASLFAACYTFYYYNLTVGTLSFEDYYLYAMITEKTYNKMVTVIFAYYMAWLYTRVERYRQADDEVKQSNHRVIHYFITHRWINALLFIVGLTATLVIFLIPFKENQNAYLWSRTTNIVYTFFANLVYPFGLSTFTWTVFMCRH